MEIIKIIGDGFVTGITSMIHKATKPELSFAVTMAGVIIILMFIVDALSGTIAVFASIANMSGVENGLIKLLLKIVGVGYIVEFGAGILQDFGAQSIADKVSLAGKITIVILSLPILESLLSLMKGFLEMI